MRKAFTLVEMLVVVAILAILMASLSMSFASAQKKARIAKATVEAGEITKAILAYGNMVDTGIPEMTEEEAGESSLPFLLGDGTDRGGNKIPIMYNGALSNGKMVDPWGHPYLVTVKAVTDQGDGDQVGKNLTTGVFLPNRYGRRATMQQTVEQ